MLLATKSFERTHVKTRIGSALALAAALSLGATGCGMFVPQATVYDYFPSDGVSVTFSDVMLRNLMVITSEDSDDANIVFTGVNNGESTARVSFEIVSEGSSQARESFSIEPGLTIFGEPDGEQAIVQVPNLQPGALVTAFIESDGTEIEKLVPVLDGTLEEYTHLVP